jgi:hypothetical protein
MPKIPIALKGKVQGEPRAKVKIRVRRKTVTLEIKLDESYTRSLLYQLKRVRGDL